MKFRGPAIAVTAALIAFVHASRNAAAQGEPGSSAVRQTLTGIRAGLETLAQRIGELFAAVPDTPAQIQRVFDLMTDFQGWPALGRALALMAVIFVLAGVAEALFRRLVRRGRLTGPAAAPQRDGIPRLAWAAADLLALGLFFLATLGLSLVFFDPVDPLRDLVTTTALARVAVAGARVVSLAIGTERPLLSTAIVGTTICAALASGLLQLYGLRLELAVLIEIACAIGVLVLLILALERRAGDRRESGLGTKLPVSLVAIFWSLWLLNEIVGRPSGAWAAAGAVAALLLHLHLSRLAAAYRARHASSATDTARQSAIHGLVLGLSLSARVALIFVVVLLAAEAAGLGVFAFLATPFGAAARSAAVNSAIALAVGYVAWAMISYFVDRKLADKSPDPGASEAAAAEAEGGTARVGTRAETLLPLFRSFATIVILAIVVLSVLSSLGVDIAPLLAGAGVAGIAIGFGAQSLVKDVVSGVFFLVDDAFRIGEYVEFGELRGEVEKISIRSLRLRHHRGAVHTVPFGEIKSITNYNRDWVIMKLKITVKYGTDVEKVRKLLKRIGQEMFAHPEYSKMLLEPPKSQGIFEFGDYGIVLRVKFKSLPREQFVIRRVLNERIDVEFAEHGVEFAYPTVTVDGAEDRSEPGAPAAAAQAMRELERART